MVSALIGVAVRQTTAWRVLFYLAIAVVALLSLTPLAEAVLSSWWDKLKHALAFAVLLLLCRLAHPRAALWPGACLLAGYGAAIELAQSRIPGRFAEWGDLLADVIGLVLVWPVVCRIRPSAPASPA